MPSDSSRSVFFDDGARSLRAVLPITAQTGKVRVKRRSQFTEYGLPVATRSTTMSQSDYIEWQIGYDLLAVSENASATSLSDRTFRNSKDRPETKYPYELSELVFHAHRFGWIDDNALRALVAAVDAVPDGSLLDVHSDMAVLRSHPSDVTLNGMSFWKMEVRYPLLVHKFGEYEIHAEIVNREKQRGVGLQPMLYVCIPLANLDFDVSPFGRLARKQETCRWIVGSAEAPLLLELFRIFGMLSARHRHDTLAILQTLFPDLGLAGKRQS